MHRRWRLRASLRADGWQAWLILALVALVAVAVVASLTSPGEAFAGSGLVGVELAPGRGGDHADHRRHGGQPLSQGY